MTGMNLTDAVQVLAGTCYGEARGGGLAAMRDVAWVVRNRVASGWAPDVPGACLAPWQFSCWNAADPNRARILAVAAAGTDPAWNLALQAARDVLGGQAPDMTGGADSYYAVTIRPPFWAKPPAVHTVTRWLHAFWRVRPARNAPAIASGSAAASAADQLNQAQLDQLLRGHQPF